MFFKKVNSIKKIDFILIFAVIALCGFGLVMIRSATLSLGSSSYVRTQLKASILGFMAMIAIMFFDYRWIGKFYLVIYGAMIAILAYTLYKGYGMTEWGANSWISIAGVNFQPAELTKIAYIVSLSKMIELNKDTINDWKTIFKLACFALFPIALIMLQPDLGTALVYVFIGLVMVFCSGISYKIILKSLGAFLLSLPILVPILWSRLDQYQKDRILNFGNKSRDVGGTGYQYFEGEIAIGSGKLTGKGLYKGTQTQYDFIPEKHSDYIFPVIGEELGFLGASAVILLYSLLLYRMAKIARNCDNLFGSSIVIGLMSLFLFHIWENIGMTVGIMPITGIPLPFMSYGGTFQLTNLISIGLCLSVALNKKDPRSFLDDMF